MPAQRPRIDFQLTLSNDDSIGENQASPHIKFTSRVLNRSGPFAFYYGLPVAVLTDQDEECLAEPFIGWSRKFDPVKCTASFPHPLRIHYLWWRPRFGAVKYCDIG